MRKNLTLYVLIPIVSNLLFVGLYFSGNEFSQHLISPIIANVPFRSWREFGLLEQLQNLLILSIVVIFTRAAFQNVLQLKKFFFAAGAATFLFLFLEEIDYGLHFYSYLTGNCSEVINCNWHNLKSIGERQNGTYLKKISDLAMILWFILLPLLNKKVSFPPLLKAVTPSLWFIPTLLIVASTSNLAHYLDGLDLDIINGVQGSLFGNTSEFRETNTYYICLLYAIQLIRCLPHITSGTNKSEHERGSLTPAENPMEDSDG